jgi:transketolase
VPDADASRPDPTLERAMCDAIRVLATDAVQAANSGYPGMPMGMAEIAVRVVSMPSTTVFDRQPAAWKAAVLPDRVPRVAIEAGVTDFWWKYVRAEGAVPGVDRFGESAPAPAVYAHFGLTVDNVVATVRSLPVLSARGGRARN